MRPPATATRGGARARTPGGTGPAGPGSGSGTRRGCIPGPSSRPRRRRSSASSEFRVHGSRLEASLQARPNLLVVLLEGRQRGGEAGGNQRVPGLEHEGQGPGQLLGSQVVLGG